MPEQIDEQVEVSLASDGMPRTFIWQRFEYEVVDIPQCFYRRSNWWSEPDTTDLTRIDQEFWRVKATTDSANFHSYDLLRRPDNTWQLMLMWE